MTRSRRASSSRFSTLQPSSLPTARVFDVLQITPPPRSLGAHALPPDTHNGDRIELPDGAVFVVRGVVLNYRLRGGRYVRANATLEVASQGRFLVEKMLEELISKE